MLVIVVSMIAGFVFAALLSDGYHDDDDQGPPDDGLMSPVFEGV